MISKSQRKTKEKKMKVGEWDFETMELDRKCKSERAKSDKWKIILRSLYKYMTDKSCLKGGGVKI